LTIDDSGRCPAFFAGRPLIDVLINNAVTDDAPKSFESAARTISTRPTAAA